MLCEDTLAPKVFAAFSDDLVRELNFHHSVFEILIAFIGRRSFPSLTPRITHSNHVSTAISRNILRRPRRSQELARASDMGVPEVRISFTDQGSYILESI